VCGGAYMGVKSGMEGKGGIKKARMKIEG